MASFNSNEAINAYYQGMKEPVNAQITQANNDYQAALQRLQQMKEQQDAENYRSYVRQQTELPGIMRASGNNGGMVDSAVASLANAYNQARAKRAMEFEGNVADRDLDYTNKLASLRAELAKYDQMANADKANLAAALVSSGRSSSGRSSTSKAEGGEAVDWSDHYASDVPAQTITKVNSNQGRYNNNGFTEKRLPMLKD